MPRLLLVEDNAGLRAELIAALGATGIACDACVNAGQASASLASSSYDLVLLDRGLPDTDGLDWLKAQRRRGQTWPCLVLTARDALHDRVDGLESGADDYLSKPFELAELVARVRALLRRPRPWQAQVTQFEDLQIDTERSMVRAHGSSVTLSAAELQLMLSLAAAKGQVLSRQRLEHAAWGLSEAVTPNALDVALHRLRRKLTALGSVVMIANSKGLGYALRLGADT